jgi:NTE family protein
LKRRIALALGGGSARGWAHIGVIRALEAEGVVPDIICGTSIGALVGAARASGELDRLQAWTEALTWQQVLGFFDLSLASGLIKGERLFSFFREHFADRPIGELPLPFGCVATDLGSGREVWLRDGSVFDAVRASVALPGLFTPVRRDGRWLVDGGLVDPVPVTLARAMGADLVIAVDLGVDSLARWMKDAEPASTPDTSPETPPASLLDRLLASLNGFAGDHDAAPPMLDVLAASLNILQTRITRSRLAGDPPDVLVRPRVGEIALMDFHRAADAIAAGRRAVEEVLPQLRARSAAS